jgi:hypothetical protein
MERQHEPERPVICGPSPERQHAVDSPVVGVHHVWPRLPDYLPHSAHAKRIRNRRVMGSTGRVNTGETHGHGREPAHPGPRRKHFIVRAARDALGSDRDGVTTVSKNICQIIHMPLLPADVRREELCHQQKTHHSTVLVCFIDAVTSNT